VFEQGRKGINMKNSAITAATTSDISDGDLKLQMPYFGTRVRHLAPTGNSHFYENFLRFYNGPARCRPRKPFKKCLKN
jgi:hypothetical protein